jgi:hypothetical protein
MSAEFDHESRRGKRGVNVHGQMFTESPIPPRISYSATNVSLLQAVQDIANLSGCSVEIDWDSVRWFPIHAGQETRTYLVPPSTAAQMAKWPEFINQDTPVNWMKESGVHLLSNGNAKYVAKRHYLIVQARAEEHRVVEGANEKAWGEYYASQESAKQRR